jgi:hypothetical protein
MSESKHTPGPWNIGEDGDVFGFENSTCVAKVCGAPENIPEALANARLIAAAPTLLAVCKAWEKYDSESFDKHPCPDSVMRQVYLKEARKLTEAAIALAEKER